MKKRQGQVWIETVIYILIALVMISLVLSFVLPRIREVQDRAIIQQSINMLEDIHSTISDLTEGGVGNKRSIDLSITKGELIIDGSSGVGHDKLIFDMQSAVVYSEPDVEIAHGDVTVLTKKLGSYNQVTLTEDYSDSYDFQFSSNKILKTISQSATPYTLLVSNKGQDDEGKTIINFELE